MSLFGTMLLPLFYLSFLDTIIKQHFTTKLTNESRLFFSRGLLRRGRVMDARKHCSWVVNGVRNAHEYNGTKKLKQKP